MRSTNRNNYSDLNSTYGGTPPACGFPFGLCKNGGTCLHGACVCPPRYSGPQCGTYTPPPPPDPCRGGNPPSTCAYWFNPRPDSCAGCDFENRQTPGGDGTGCYVPGQPSVCTAHTPEMAKQIKQVWNVSFDSWCKNVPDNARLNGVLC